MSLNEEGNDSTSNASLQNEDQESIKQEISEENINQSWANGNIFLNYNFINFAFRRKCKNAISTN